MFVQYENKGDYVIIDIGKKYVGNIIHSGTSRLPITPVNRDGYAQVLYNVFLKFREDMYLDDEKIDFKQ